MSEKRHIILLGLFNSIYPTDRMFSRMSLNTFPSVLIGINVTWLSDVREFKLFKIYVWSYIILVFLLWLGLYIFREKYVVVFRQQLMSMRKLHWYHENRVTESLACITDYFVYSLLKCLLFIKDLSCYVTNFEVFGLDFYFIFYCSLLQVRWLLVWW